MKTLDEVINALEVHGNGKLGDCDKCCYSEADTYCVSELHRDVLRFLRVLREMQEDRNKEIMARDKERQRENKAPILRVPEEKPQPKPEPMPEPEKPLPWEDPWRKAPEVELPADWIRVDNTAINPEHVLYVICQDERTIVVMRGDRKLTTPGNPFGLEE